MCGRYYVDEDTAKEIRKVIRDLERKLALEAAMFIHRNRRLC